MTSLYDYYDDTNKASSGFGEIGGYGARGETSTQSRRTVGVQSKYNTKNNSYGLNYGNYGDGDIEADTYNDNERQDEDGDETKKYKDRVAFHGNRFVDQNP